MLKIGTKRRRTTQEIIDSKQEAQLKEEAIEQKLQRLDQLQDRCQ
jgi:hypothetical protein